MLVYPPDCVRHVNLPGHVEAPERVEAIFRRLDHLGFAKEWVVPEPATRQQIESVHTKPYVDLVQDFGEGYLDTDTAIHPETFTFAKLAAGGAVAASLECAKGRRPVFALVRPPGHHAGPDYGGGFCYLNNVAIATAQLLERFERVAILDFDAHHGNGTRDIFAARREVLYVSTHQQGIFPGTGPAEDVGEGTAAGYTVNLPLPARAGDSTYARAFDEVIEPIVRQYVPHAILVSFGVDAHYKDPLTGLGLSSPGYVSLAQRTTELARSVAEGRVAFVLEGGYHLPALAEVVAGTCASFRGESVDLQFRDVVDPSERGKEAVFHARRVHREYWDL